MKVKVGQIEISNPERIVYPKEKITKLDIAKFYHSVSKFMMPFLSDRLLSVIRAHDGINGELFFKKHPTTETKLIKKYQLNGEQDYFYLPSEKAIVNQAQMGTIEFHIWASRITAINKPDIMTFDLDPDHRVSLTQLRIATKELKEVLDKLKLKSFLKTSGGKGYHVLVPFNAGFTWNNFEKFAHDIALYLKEEFPKLFTTNIRKVDRQGKIFIDYLRNGKGATCVCPYSLRARDGAKISMPIAWKDIDDIAPADVDIFNYQDYIKKNPWKDFEKLLRKKK